MVRVPDAANINPFYLSNEEVSLADFEQFVSDRTYSDSVNATWKSFPEYSSSGANPVVGVTQINAVEFCKWLSWKEQLDAPCTTVSPSHRS